MRRSLQRATRATFLALTLACAAPTAAMAATHTVCAGGCGFTTIQAALDAAGDGDVIQVAAGTYAESLDVAASVTITGAKAGIDGRTRATDDGETIITGGADVAIDATDDLVLDGVVVESTATTAIDTGDDLVLRNAKVRGAGTGDDTVTVASTDTVLVEQSAISRTANAGSALRVAGVTTVTVRSSTFSAPASGTMLGVELVGGGTTAVTGNSFRGFDRSVVLSGAFTTPPSVRLNRFQRATSSSDIVYSTTTGAVDATDNHWGCDAVEPRVDGTCDVLGGSGAASVTAVPYLVVQVTAAASPLPAVAPATITAALRRQDGSAVPDALTPFDGVPLAWSMTGAGASLTPRDTSFAAGATSATLTPNPIGGTIVIRVSLDTANYSASLTARGAAPTFSRPAAIDGAARFGTRLTCARPDWTRADSEVVAWQRNGATIAGADDDAYTPTAADVGRNLTCSRTVTAANADPATSTSAPVKVAKRRVTLAALQSNARGVGNRCGTARKACVHRRPATMYLKVTRHASHFTRMKVQVVLERKVRRRWVPTRPRLMTVTARPFAIATRSLPAGAWRMRVVLPGSKVDQKVASAYRYVTLR